MKINLSCLVAIAVIACTQTSVIHAQNSRACQFQISTSVEEYKKLKSALARHDQWGERYNATIDRKDCRGARKNLDKMKDALDRVIIHARRCRNFFRDALQFCSEKRALLRKGRDYCAGRRSYGKRKQHWLDVQKGGLNCSNSSSRPALDKTAKGTATVRPNTTKSTSTIEKPSGLCDRVSTSLGDAWYCVSSKLPNNPRTRYEPKLMADNSGKTAWIEGAKGHGVGEWIRIQFVSGPKEVRRITFRNGFPHDDRRYKGNGRLKSVRIEMSDGKRVRLSLHDTAQRQGYQLPTAKRLSWVKFTILSVYPGNLWEDTALSELHLR